MDKWRGSVVCHSIIALTHSVCLSKDPRNNGKFVPRRPPSRCSQPSQFWTLLPSFKKSTKLRRSPIEYLVMTLLD